MHSVFLLDAFLSTGIRGCVYLMCSSHWDPVVSYSFNTCLLMEDGRQSAANYFRLEAKSCRIAIVRSSIGIISYLSISLWITFGSKKKHTFSHHPPNVPSKLLTLKKRLNIQKYQTFTFKIQSPSPFQTTKILPWGFTSGFSMPGDTFAESFGGTILWAARAFSTCKAK